MFKDLENTKNFTSRNGLSEYYIDELVKFKTYIDSANTDEFNKHILLIAEINSLPKSKPSSSSGSRKFITVNQETNENEIYHKSDLLETNTQLY